MKRKAVMVASATAMALAAGVVAASQANADADPDAGMHYVAFLADPNISGAKGRHGVNSFQLTNKNKGGGTRCFDVSSMTSEGGAYTTGYKVYNDTDLEVFSFTSNNCTESPGYFQENWIENVVSDTAKYWYVSVLGKDA